MDDRYSFSGLKAKMLLVPPIALICDPCNKTTVSTLRFASGSHVVLIHAYSGTLI